MFKGPVLLFATSAFIVIMLLITLYVGTLLIDNSPILAMLAIFSLVTIMSLVSFKYLNKLENEN